MQSQKLRLLFLDKLLLDSAEAGKARGVHLFNRSLLKELHSLNYSLTVPCTGAWREYLEQDTDLNLITVPERGGVVFKSCLGTLKAHKYKPNRLILANSTSGLSFAAKLFFFLNLKSKGVLIAHKMASDLFLKVLKGSPITVLGVNQLISEQFISSGFSDVHTYYGVTNWQNFFPKKHLQKSKVNFCVMGDLDNDWKGADTALEVFNSLDDDLRDSCKLHLAAFQSPSVEYQKDFIELHRWVSFENIPNFLNEMDVLLVPSRDLDIMKETFSQAMVQGMLAGLPVVASSLPVLKEKLPEGRGGFSCSNIEDYKNAIRELYSDCSLRARLGQEARKTALQHYCWDTNDFATRFL